MNTKNKITLVLFVFTGFCITAELFRMWYSFTLTYFFLMWNLVLAWVPYLLSIKFQKMDLGKNKIKAAILFMLWLLFMPNAPYMITDLIHLRLREFVPLWFDMLLISSFAWLGLLLALLSIMNMHRKLQARLSPLVLRAGLFIIFFSAGYGIYAGRFLRWNSWDVFWRPFQLIGYSVRCIIHPFHHPCAAGVTVIVGMILSCSYSVIYLLSKN